jgi:hypothetical protein
LGARYQSQKLTLRTSLYHSEILIKVAKDLRKVDAYKTNGESIGVLYAKGKWGRHKHSRWVRKLYNDLKKSNELSSKNAPVIAVTNYLYNKAKNSKKHRNMLVKLTMEQSDGDAVIDKDYVIKQINETEDKEQKEEIIAKPNRHRIQLRQKII